MGSHPVRVGEWSGTTEGQAGTGRVKRRYEFVLGGNVIEPAEAGARRFVFASERFENLAEGWRARERDEVCRARRVHREARGRAARQAVRGLQVESVQEQLGRH